MITEAKPLPPFIPELRSAIRNGTKTQTRRVINPQPILHYRRELYRTTVDEFGRAQWRYEDPTQPNAIAYVRGPDEPSTIQCPYGKPGDVRYLREPLQSFNRLVHYADDAKAARTDGDLVRWKWKRDRLNSIYMPNEYARTFVQIDSIRVQRVQDISEEDAKAEGVECPGCTSGEHVPCSYREGFKLLWQSINDKRDGGKYAWTKNPWLFCIAFHLVPRPEHPATEAGALLAEGMEAMP